MNDFDSYLNLCTQYYDLDKPIAPTDAFSLYLGYARQARGPILEPMCGTGRFLLPLLEAGFEAHGFDASRHMLEALHKKATVKNLNPSVWQGFLQDLERSEKYGFVFIPSGSFGLITNLDQAMLSLKQIYKHMQDNGIFVFEAETLKAASTQAHQWRGSVRDNGGNKSIIASFLDLPLNDNIRTTHCRYELVGNNTVLKTEVETIRVRLYEPEQLVGMLKDAGFRDIKMVKAFEPHKTPDAQDKLIIYECRR